MCGIIGYVGKEQALDLLLNGLQALEYRGYDSAGVALYQKGNIAVVKAEGKLSNLREKLEKSGLDLQSHCGIGHTRWATHGKPNDVNSHPHATENLTLVHNGIIENYAELKRLLEKEEHYRFVSETDTEVAAKVFPVAKKVAQAVKDTLGCDGVNILQNNGTAAGQSVFHLHVHVVPRYEGDGILPVWPQGSYEDGEAAALAARIRANID